MLPAAVLTAVRAARRVANRPAAAIWAMAKIVPFVCCCGRFDRGLKRQRLEGYYVVPILFITPY
jgi:hypothetical protein